MNMEKIKQHKFDNAPKRNKSCQSPEDVTCWVVSLQNVVDDVSLIKLQRCGISRAFSGTANMVMGQKYRVPKKHFGK